MARRGGKAPRQRKEPHFDEARAAPAVRSPGRNRTTARRSQGKRTSLMRRLMRLVPRVTYWGVVLGLWAVIAVAGIVGWYGAQLPAASSWTVPKRAANIRILAEDGTLLLNRGVGGFALRMEDMAPSLPQAVIAIEDRRFHSHFGFDVIGFARALTSNLVKGRISQGGSTLTQQLAKNLFLEPERTLRRKIQELILALWLETQYSKAEILELYLNRVYFGAGAYGVDAASRRYFGKSPSALTVEESAMLAGLLKAPSRYSPARHPKRAQKRTKVVLAAMRREGYLKPGSGEVQHFPQISTRYYRSGPEHFIADLVVRRVREHVGKIKRDITVQTTISPYLMTAANNALQAALDGPGKNARATQAAYIAMRPDGAIVALIGGRNYAKSQFNRVTEAKRQPGSAFKPFAYQAAFEAGSSLDRIKVDEPVRFGKWVPTNYTGKYLGPITLREALAKSVNTVAAKLITEVGPRRVAMLARRAGIGSPLKANASLALGTSEVSLQELTGAYGAYANGGLRVQPHLIRSIRDDRKTLYRHKDSGERIFSADIASMMSAAMQGVVGYGTGRNAAVPGHAVAGKTGTSQDGRDALFVGYTAHFVAGLWMGNDDNTPTKLTGGALPAKVWGEIMAAAVSGLPSQGLNGDAGALAALDPAVLPRPTFRPGTITEEDGKTPSNFAKLRQKTAKTILDLLTGG